MIIDRRSRPIITLSFAISKQSMVTLDIPMLAACSAASLQRLARSAPVNPGVPLAKTSRWTSSARGICRVWTWRICSLPFTSGLGTTTWRSKRPGRSKAGSRTSGRFVAAIRISPSFDSNPSISTRSWFSVCSRSSCPPPGPAPPSRNRPGQQGLPGPRRPHEQHPLGDAPAQLRELLGVLQKRDDLLELLLGLIDPGDVREGALVGCLGQKLRTALAARHRLPALDGGGEFREGDLLVLHPLRLERVEEEHHRQGDEHPQGQIAIKLVQGFVSPVGDGLIILMFILTYAQIPSIW